MADRGELKRQRLEAMSSAENDVFKAALKALATWLKNVAASVLGAFHKYDVMPDPTGIWSTIPQWHDLIDEIVEGPVAKAARAGWEQALDIPWVSTNSFVQAQLAMTKNLLVRIPDEVYNLIFAEISDGTNNGESIAEIADRVDKVLSITSSQRWPNRARTIAQTETIRAFNAGAYASGLQAEQFEKTSMVKEWLATKDTQTRPSHRRADGQKQPLNQPFDVGGFPLQFPGDPMGPPEEVINCRCALVIEEEGHGS
jgi:hypothetical protein